MARSVEEWIGRSDDHRAPGSVRDRILARDKCCHLCGKEIRGGERWDLDHVIALINGGENRETNLRPAHQKCHREKTARDVAEKAKVARVRKRHLGITQPKGKIKSAAFPKLEKPRHGVDKSVLPPLPRNQLFAPADRMRGEEKTT